MINCSALRDCDRRQPALFSISQYWQARTVYAVAATQYSRQDYSLHLVLGKSLFALIEALAHALILQHPTGPRQAASGLGKSKKDLN